MTAQTNTLDQMTTYLFNAMARLDGMAKLDETEIQLESSRNAQLKGLADTILNAARVQIDNQKMMIDFAKGRMTCIPVDVPEPHIPLLGSHNAKGNIS